jgi:hypothetical protein
LGEDEGGAALHEAAGVVAEGRAVLVAQAAVVVGGGEVGWPGRLCNL